MELASVLKERRGTLGISQTDLAEISGVSLCTVKDIERGKGNPSLAVIEKICDVLGLEVRFEIKRTVV